MNTASGESPASVDTVGLHVIEFTYDISKFTPRRRLMGRVREPIQVYLSTAERERLDRVHDALRGKVRGVVSVSRWW